MAVTSTLAYYNKVTFTAVKSFIVQTPGPSATKKKSFITLTPVLPETHPPKIQVLSQVQTIFFFA